jgi:hypothetical protein
MLPAVVALLKRMLADRRQRVADVAAVHSCSVSRS